MIECSALPTIGVMAGRADCPELTTVGIVRGMTGHTLRGRASEYTIHMAGLAGNAGVRPGQCEGRIIVVEVDILPAAGIVAGGAVGPKLAAVRLQGGMAGVTVLGCAFEDAVDVTGRAWHVYMPTRERKTRLVMIETHIPPGAGVMAGATICAKLAAVRIVLRVTGKAVGCGAFEDAVEMTCGTGHGFVAVDQWKTGRAVIEANVIPICRIVAAGAIPIHLAVVDVAVTGGAVLRRAFESVVLVAICAGNTRMLTQQREGGFGMIEGDFLPVRWLVARTAILS